MTSALRIATWEQLPIESILNLCKSSKDMAQICKDPTTWNILLKRDYGITYRGNNALKKYTKNVIRDIVALLYDIIEYNKQEFGCNKRVFNDLHKVVEFLGYSNKNRYEIIHGNKIGTNASSLLKSPNLSSLVEYKQMLRNTINERNEFMRRFQRGEISIPIIPQ